MVMRRSHTREGKWRGKVGRKELGGKIYNMETAEKKIMSTTASLKGRHFDRSLFVHKYGNKK